MTEVTRVPLQPIAKGALPKLWIALALLLFVAAGIAWAAMPSSVDVETLTVGEGEKPTTDDVVLVNYKGMLKDGTVFDEGQQTPMPVGDLIPGFTKALQEMQRGGKYLVTIPSDLAYGPEGAGPIPANSDLIFEVELLDFRSRAEIEQQQRMMQQLQQMQQQGGAPGGAQHSGGAPQMPPIPPTVPGNAPAPGGQPVPPPPAR